MFGSFHSKSTTPKRVISSAEVEKYINKVQSRLSSPLEKKSKSFAFARLYYDAKDYELSKKYLKEYISVQDRDFRVHNLMGEINEALENYEDAFTSYKRSLELNSTQKEILIKVMTLCTKCSVDPWRAKVWADKGAKYCPGHPAVFDVKWHLLSQSTPKDYEEMELLIADELTRRARDSSLHIKLVNLYMETESLHQAYMHCESVEKTGVFNEDIAWLTCATDIFDAYRKTEDGYAVCSSYMLSLCKLMHLHLKLSTTVDGLPTLKRMDNSLYELTNTKSVDVRLGIGRELNDSLNEMKGQIYNTAATYILKLAEEGTISYAKANRFMCVYMMASWMIKPPSITSKLFTRHSPSKRQSLQAYDWSVLACGRLSETGHLILALESQYGEEWMRESIQDFCNVNGKKLLLEALSIGNDDVAKSFLGLDEDFFKTEIQLPDTSALVKYDEVAVSEHAQDLQLIIWLGLHWDKLNERIRPGVGVMVGRMFEGIGLDVNNMKNCHFTSLSLRDVEAFIYGVIRSSKSVHMDAPREAEDKLHILPVQISPNLITSAQGEWWRAAYGLYTGKVGTQGAAKMKVTLQKGLETIRCIRDHGIDPRILIYMASAFWEKANFIESTKKSEVDYQDHWQSLQRRAVFYLQEAIRILEIYKRNKTIAVVEQALIPPLEEPLLGDVVEGLLNKSYLKLAESSMVTGELQDALKYYDEVKSLQAVYAQVQIYLKLASKCDLQTVNGEKDHLYYTTKAKEKLAICISNADHSPEFKTSLLEQLRELEMMTSSITKDKLNESKSKKCLDFTPGTPSRVNSTQTEVLQDTPLITSESILMDSMLQQQLVAKEKENQILKQTLEMYRAQIHLQRQQQLLVHSQLQPPVHTHSPIPVQSHPGGPQPQYIVQQPQILPHPTVPLQPPPGALVRPIIPTGSGAHPTIQQSAVPPNMNRQVNRVNSNGSAVVTPTLRNGVETPTDMWWDSFSPQPSFEKGYFAGLAEHVEQSREELGEEEAPTMRDSETTPSIDKTKSINETPKNNSVTKTPLSATKTPTYDGDDIYVQPIVKLEGKGPQITGEEDEVVKFTHRAKLYRFDKDVNQWKERGVGEVKILVNEKTNKARITMRRDQVFRVCCNHVITADMSLESKEGSKAAWTWCTPADASEDEVRAEQFTIRFKTQETADQFHEVFKECQKLPPPKKDIQQNTEESKKKELNKKEPVPGQWTCEFCYVENTPDAVQCIACQGTKPGFINLNAGNQSINQTPKFNFSVPPNQIPSLLSFGTPPAPPQTGPFIQQQVSSSTTPKFTIPPNQVITSQQSVPNVGFTPNISTGFKSDQYGYPIDANASYDYDPDYDPEYYDDEYNHSYDVNDITPSQFNMYPRPPANIQQGFLMPSGTSQGVAMQQPGQQPSPANLFRFKAPENTITTSPEGKPVFNFAMNSSQSKKVEPVNPFLMNQSNTTPLPPFDMNKDTTPSTTTAEISKPNPFAGFSFKKDTTSDITSQPVTAAVSSPFSGFSFSSKPANTQSVPATTSVTHVKTTSGDGFPMLTSLLQTSVSTTAPTNTVISGMNTLPVFGKGVVTTGIDPTAFWTAGAAVSSKPFFTGNTTGLDKIGHQEEPREVDEDEFFNENSEVTNEIEEGELEDDYYEENGEYYGDEIYGDYGDNEDYDEYDSDDEYDEEYEDQHSAANSSRRGSTEEIGDVVDRSKQVEERFEIQKRTPPPRDLDDVINDEVIITFESKPSFAQKIKASRLKLPQTFYLYETKQPCPGCRGCVEDFKTQTVTKKNEKETEKINNDEQKANSISDPKIATTMPIFGAKSNTINSFSALSSNASGFSKVGGSFTGAGSALFGEQENDGEYDPHYEAIVQVEKLESIKTGEEDDDIIFKHRAKLYRFDKQWKERGVGDIKLTKNIKSGYCRVIMRRDLIHKLCANHAIMPNMELKPLESSEKAWVWFTPSDYSEGMPPVPQQFCVKFKNKQVADEFKSHFTDLKKFMDELIKSGGLGESKSNENESDKENKAVELDEKEIKPSTDPFAKFTLKKGEWECSVCQIRNEKLSKNCVACNSPNPAVPLTDDKNEVKFGSTSDMSTNNKFSFGLPQNNGVSFGTSDNAGFKFGVSNDSNSFGGSNESQPLFGVSKEPQPLFGATKEPQSLFGANKEQQPLFGAAKEPQPLFGATKEPQPLFGANKEQQPLFGATKEPQPLFGATKEPQPLFGTTKEPQLLFGASKESQPLFGATKEPRPLFGATKDTQNVSGTTENTKPLFETSKENRVTVGDSTPTKNLFGTPSKVDVNSLGDTPFDLDDNMFKNNSPFKFISPSKDNDKEKEEAKAKSKSTPDKKYIDIKAPAENTEKPPLSPTKYNNKDDPDIHVEAIVKVSKVDKITTGEEGEEIIFSHRAKLYRFASDVKQWKERGIGDIKLTHEKTKNTCRVIMRREQVHKVCANHMIGPLMELKSQNSEKSWTWFTSGDFSEGEVKPEQFLVRFKNADIAQEFKTAFDKCKGFISDEEHKKEIISPPKKEGVKPKVDLLAKFAPAAGSWECGTCMIQNNADVSKCVACQTPNPDSTVTSSSDIGKPASFTFGTSQPGGFTFGQKTENTTSGFSFGLPKESTVTSNQDTKPKVDLLAKFAPAAGSWECGTCMIQNNADVSKCVACQTPNPDATVSSSSDIRKPAPFTFGASQPGGFACGKKAEDSTSVFSFGLPKESTATANQSPFTFGLPKQEATPSLSFGQLPATSISFGTKPDLIPSQESTNLNTKNDLPDIEKQVSATSEPRSIDPDHEPWQCSACLAQNNTLRDLCRNCSSPRMKAPVVRLDPKQFSAPINFNIENKNENPTIFAPTQSTQPKFNEPLFGKSASSGSSGFSFGQSSLPKPDLTAMSDRELMPPPKDIPIKTKTSPKQSPPKKDSIFSWMPKGLNTDNLFSFGTAPSPTLSAASSYDDLSTKSTANVPSAFANATFSFQPIDTPKKSPIKETIKSPEITSSQITSPHITSPSTLEEESTAEFTPIVSLAKVERKTGEENEEIIFSERSKMFRFDSQWKERGIGELKILKHTQTGLYRLIMRRDQTHKLCANHALINGMTIKPMGGNKKSYIWKTGADMSDDDTPKEQMFAARFKTEELAERFAQLFTDVCNEQTSAPDDDKVTNAAPDILQGTQEQTIHPNDVIVISDNEEEEVKPLPEGVSLTYEANPSEDLKEKARKFLLPESFYYTPSVTIGKYRPSKTEAENSASKSTSEPLRPDTKVENVIYKDEDEMKHDSSVEMIYDDIGETLQKLNSGEYSTLVDGSINVIHNTKNHKHYILSISTEDQVQVQLDVNTVNVNIQKGSRHVCEMKSRSNEYFIKFSNMLSLEKFIACIKEVKEVCESKSDEVDSTIQQEEKSDKPIFGSASNTTSFAALAADSTSGFQSNSGKSFATSGNTIFQSEENEEVDSGDIYVKPIVQLSTVEVTTGEENEEVYFDQRCKMYRFNSGAKQWKERGIGQLKLLYNRNTEKSRLVMRRDQVRKLCANHSLSETMKLEPFATNELTVTWNAIGDMSENTPEDIIVAAKFKNQDILSEFRNTFAILCEGKNISTLECKSKVAQENDGPSINGACDIKLSNMVNSIE